MLPLLSGTAVAVTLLIAIHFFGLRLRQKLDFSHIQFLTALISRTQSVRKINNYLLLLLRLVFVASALGAFLLFLHQSNQASSALGGDVSVIVDDTWSMQSSSPEKGSLKADLATVAAKDILEFNNKEVSSERIQNESATRVSFTFSEDLLGNITQQSRSSRTYILSDFQRATFTPKVLKSLPKDQAITLVSYAGANVPNIYVDSVWLDQPILLPGALAGMSVRVAGSLLDKSTQVKVTASNQNKLVGATQVLLEPGQKVVAHFKLPLTREEAKHLVFEVEDIGTPFDNQFYVVVPKPVSMNIRVNGSIPTTHPIVQAFKAEPAFTLSKQENGNADLWILDIPSTGINASTVNELTSWLDRGGSVLLFPSSPVQNSTISFLRNIGLKGVSEESKEVGVKSLKQPDMSDAFFNQVFEKEVKNMKMPEEKPVLRWQSSYHTILRFTDNTPFLSAFKIGKGNVHLFSAPISNTTSFVSHPLFVPVLYQLALTAHPTKTVLSHQSTNGSLVIPLETEIQTRQPYSLTLDGQTYVPDQRVRQNQLMMTLPKDLSKPGFYNLKVGEKVISSIAINIPRVESRLEGYTAEELKDILADHENVQVVEPRERVSLQKQLQKEASGTSLWKYCLILCFLCLVVEAVILSTKKSGSLS